MRYLIVMALALIGSLSDSSSVSIVLGQPPATDWRKLRMELENEFGDELRKVADWCLENGTQQQADETLQLFQDRDPGRQYIFLPSESAMPKATGELQGQWLEKINTAKTAHAARIFELAKQASQKDEGAVAFQLLFEVIRYDRDHAAVRNMLGHRKSDEGWRVASESLRFRPGQRPHDLIRWPANGYNRLLTPHFEIESNASQARTEYLAKKLELAHLVWRQVFFEYWSSPAAIKRWIQGKGTVPISRRRFRVIFFKDRESYLKQLVPLVKGVEVSTGYYSSDQEVSYFYDGGEQIESTWRHELTHQLFRESGRATNKQAFEQQFIWLDEGIATYFESMTDFGDFVTLGGFESQRIQYARIRRLLENFHLPTKQLSAIGRTELQSRSDMIRIYSEAAGLADMLMNDESGADGKRLTEFLRLIYRGRVKSGKFEEIIGKSFEELDDQYQAFLQVSSDLVEKQLTRPESRTELSLTSADLKPAAFDMLGKCVNLNWLDLSGNTITSADLSKLKRCQRINQLFLNRCQFNDDSLRKLDLFGNLDDLDLSNSSVEDFHLSTFHNLSQLKSLRLASTEITDQGLMHLQNVRTLKSLDVSRTKVTDQGLLNLKASLPNLQITR